MRSCSNRRGGTSIAFAIAVAGYFFWCSSASSDFFGDSDNTRVVVANYYPAKGGVKLDPGKFYRVVVTCTAHVNSATQISDTLFIKSSKFVSHTLWLSNVPVSQNSIPTTPAKLINVFSFQKDLSGNIVDATNPKCRETFLISGTTATLTVSYAVNDSNTLSTFGQVIDNVATILSGIVPILITGPLQKSIVSGGTAVAGTGGPIQNLITAISATPQTSIRSYPLLSGTNPTTVTTAYKGVRFSDVSIKIIPIDDISAQVTADNVLRTSFYQTLDGLSTTYLAGITSANAPSQCGKFASTLQNYYNFNKKDVSFIIGYFAQSAFPASLDDRMYCVGNKNNAEDIVNYQFIYNQRASGAVGALLPLSQTAIDAHPWDVSSHVLLNPGIAAPYLELLMDRIAIYAQSKSDTEKGANATALTKVDG